MSKEAEVTSVPAGDGEFLIRDRDAFAQKVLFGGLRWGPGAPTDVDIYCEFRGRLFVFAELKYQDTVVPRGQELALERLVEAIREGTTKRAILLVAEHETPRDADIQAEQAVIVRHYAGRKWISSGEYCGLTLRQFFHDAMSKDPELRQYLAQERGSSRTSKAIAV